MFLAQLLYYIGALLSVPLLPVLYFQGKKLRKHFPRMPEAGHNIAGSIHEGAGQPIRLLAMGESTIAGVGVEDHRYGFTGELAAALSAQTGRPVEWQVVARSGYDAKDTFRKLVPQIPATSFDLVVIGLGGNDTFYLNSPLHFRHNMALLVKALRERLPGTPIIIAALPPVGVFPALPGLVRAALGALVHLHGFAIRNIPRRFAGVHYPGGPIRARRWLDDSHSPKDFFSDGIHPSPEAYRLWAEETARFWASRGVKL